MVDANTGDDLLFGGKGDDILWAADFGAAPVAGGGGDGVRSTGFKGPTS